MLKEIRKLTVVDNVRSTRDQIAFIVVPGVVVSLGVDTIVAARVAELRKLHNDLVIGPVGHAMMMRLRAEQAPEQAGRLDLDVVLVQDVAAAHAAEIDVLERAVEHNLLEGVLVGKTLGGTRDREGLAQAYLVDVLGDRLITV